MEKHASLLVRVAQFDRAFDAKSQDGLVIGVLFQGTNPASVQEKDEFSAAMSAIEFRDAQDRPVDIVEIQADRALGSSLDAAGVDVLYVAQLLDVDLRWLTDSTRSRGILTFTSQTGYVEQGLAVALEPGHPEPRILINLTAVDSEGSDFRPGLLKMAKVIQR
jgi:hypothetical protein